MKMKILIIDAIGSVAGPLSEAFKAEGWTARREPCAGPQKLAR